MRVARTEPRGTDSIEAWRQIAFHDLHFGPLFQITDELTYAHVVKNDRDA